MADYEVPVITSCTEWEKMFVMQTEIDIVSYKIQISIKNKAMENTKPVCESSNLCNFHQHIYII